MLSVDISYYVEFVTVQPLFSGTYKSKFPVVLVLWSLQFQQEKPTFRTEDGGQRSVFSSAVAFILT